MHLQYEWCVRRFANKSLAGWSTHQLQLNSWPLQANTESRLRKCQAASLIFAYCGLARLPPLYSAPRQFVSQNKEGDQDKQKAGNDGREVEKTGYLSKTNASVVCLYKNSNS